MNRRCFFRVLLLLGMLVAGPHGPAPAQSWFSRPRGGSQNLVVDFLDIGQGDSVLIQSPEGKVALVDAGPSRDGAVNLLKQKGITSLDIVIVSHHHTDHFIGMDQVIRQYKPRYFMATGSSHTTKSYLRLLETVKSAGITSIEPTSKPRKIELGSVTMTVFPQPKYNHDEENNNSIGIRLDYGSFSVLMTGDSETDERRWWLGNNPNLLRDCTVLKLAHHGSRNGTDQELLKVVRPEIAVASLAAGNDYGHPHSETISLLRRNNIPLLRTDLRGTITLVSNGRTWNLVNPELAKRSKSDRGASVASRTTAEESSPRKSTSTRTRRR